MRKQLLTFPLSVKIIYEAESIDAPYVAYAPELDVSSCGPSEEMARKNLSEVVRILFEEAERKGKLNEFLEDLGFRKIQRKWRSPRVSFQQMSVLFKIPESFDAQDLSYSLS